MITLADMAKGCGARIVANRAEADIVSVRAVHGSDKISELLNAATHGTLIVTNLSNSQLLRVAELMEAPGICLVNGATPADALLQAAEECGAVLMVSPHSMRDTLAQMRRQLSGGPGG